METVWKTLYVSVPLKLNYAAMGICFLPMKHSATIMDGYWFPFRGLLSYSSPLPTLLGHTPFELLFLLLVIFFCGWDVGIKLRISESLKMVYSHAGPVTKSSDVQVRRTGADSCIAGFLFLMLHLSWIPSQIHLQNCCIKIFPELKEVLDHSVKMVSYSVNSAPKVDTAEQTSVCIFAFLWLLWLPFPRLGIFKAVYAIPMFFICMCACLFSGSSLGIS